MSSGMIRTSSIPSSASVSATSADAVSSEETVNGICRQIREQIIHFEPRLDPKSVLVEAKNSDGQRRNSLTVSVSARISQNPFSADEVNCRFVLDLETGIPRLDQAGGRT